MPTQLRLALGTVLAAVSLHNAFSELIEKRGELMRTTKQLAACAATAMLLLSLGACGGMSEQGRNTAVGAGVGAVGGAVLTGGSTIGTLGGAAVGGVVGHEVAK